MRSRIRTVEEYITHMTTILSGDPMGMHQSSRAL